MNIAEILMNCPKGTKLYSPLFGEVKLDRVNDVIDYPIHCLASDGATPSFMSDGRYYGEYSNTECMLFPSEDQRDWHKFKIPNQSKPKHQFKPFERVLVRDDDIETWMCNFFSHLDEDGDCVSSNGHWHQCIPYEGNEHLLGTNNDPE